MQTNIQSLDATSGFTAQDLAALGEIHSSALARRVWTRSQIISNEFSQYLAVWGPGNGAEEPPALVLARFKKTGTYVLTVGSTIVASGRSLGTVLPALAAGIAPVSSTSAG
jgi:hypothetical protein